MVGNGRSTFRGWLASRWTPVTAVAAGVLLIAGITGYVLSDDGSKAPATKVLSGTFTPPPPAPAGTGASATTTTASVAPTTRTSDVRTSAPTTTVPSPTGITAVPGTTLPPVCRNSTDPRCGPFRWDGTPVNQGLTLDIRWSPANPEIGQPVTFTLTMSDPDAPADGFSQSFGFGDGGALVADDFPDECDRYGLWSLPEPKPGRWVDTYTHTYSRTGTFEAWFTRTSRTPGLPGCVDSERDLGDPWASSATIKVSITVTASSPARPVWTQPSDNVVFLEYQSVGQRSRTSSMSPGAGSGILAFTVDAEVIGDVPATARLRASLRNQRDFPLTFPGGVDVVVHVNRNGQRWQDVHLRNAGLVTLAPGAVTELTATVALPGFGAYDVSGEVTYLGP